MPNEPFRIQEENLYILIDDMFHRQDQTTIEPHLTQTQKAIFHNEIALLDRFGLHKRFFFKPKNGRYDASTSARRTSTDGKVNIHAMTAAGTTFERYFDDRNRRRYTRRIKHAFVQTYFVKSNQELSYRNNVALCQNCGADLKRHGDVWHCEFCDTTYQVEALQPLLARFSLENALRGFWKIWLVLGPIIIIATLYQAGIIDESLYEQITQSFAMIVGGILTALIVLGLGVGLFQLFRHHMLLSQIRQADPHFSTELLTQRIADLFHLEPERVWPNLPDDEGRLFRNIDHILLTGRETTGTHEQIRLTARVTHMRIQKHFRSVRIKDHRQKLKLTITRSLGTQTAVHYNPEQYTCPSCGAHTTKQTAQLQTCAFCKRETPMDQIDWVFDPSHS